MEARAVLGRRSASVGSRTLSLGWLRSPCCVATSSGRLDCSRDRYAARHDALGVADVEERLRGLERRC